MSYDMNMARTSGKSSAEIIKEVKSFIMHPRDTILIIIDEGKNWTETRLLMKAIKKEYQNTYRKESILFLTKKDISDVNKINCVVRGSSITKVEFRTMLPIEDYKRLSEIIIPSFYFSVQSKHFNLLKDCKE